MFHAAGVLSIWGEVGCDGREVSTNYEGSGQGDWASSFSSEITSPRALLSLCSNRLRLEGPPLRN